MNQRLIWNFEFSPKTAKQPLKTLAQQESETLKWEIRFFWPDDLPIVLNNFDNSLLDMANYQKKHREDYYYLLPESKYNIKRRRNELLYKPLLQQTAQVLGFGAKINLDVHHQGHEESNSAPTYLQEIAQRIATEGVEVYVKKEAFIYKFSTNPTVKLELARIEVHNGAYLSACIEGKSRALVEEISQCLLGEHVSCDYVTFLKDILHHD